MQKPWLSSYPEGIPEDIDIHEYPSVTAIFDESVKKFANRTAVTNFGVSLTYAELDTLTARFAAYLQNTLGLKKGDRIALMMPNLLQYPVAIFGALRAGLVVVNTNPMYTERELQHQLTDSGARAIVVLEKFASTLQAVVDDTDVEHIITTTVGDMLGFIKGNIFNFVLRVIKKEVPAFQLPQAHAWKNVTQADPKTWQPVEQTHEDLAFLQYTGGTTGVAKGAMLTHKNLVANMLQSRLWIGTHANSDREVVITALPLYHIFALTANCLVFISLGGTNYLITDPRNMPDFVKQLKGIRFTGITGVNTLFNGLLNTPGFEDVDFSNLTVSLGGGMAVQRAVAERWKEVTGCTLVEAYGLTETSPAACINPFDLDEYNGCIGLPIPSTEACIRDNEGNMLQAGEVGELCIRGPQVMKGYWQRPAETAKVLDDDGWLRTGDIATFNEAGFFKIVDRKKDMILVSGFNVYPNEIEDVAVSHPGVLEAAAIGIADERSGEAVKLFVVRKDESVTEEDVAAHCKENLTGYKRPKIIEFRDDLPKSNVGKILRRELRDDD